MKITNVLLSLTLAGLCFSYATAQEIRQSVSTSPAARHIGDGVRSIGDSNRLVALPEDNRPPQFKTESSAPSVLSKPVSHATMLDNNMLAPTASCGSYCQPASCYSSSCCGTGASSFWLSAESLLWFSDNPASPPLVTSSPNQVLPVAGAPGVSTQFGGSDGIEFGLLPGYRISAGMYLGDSDKVAVGGRVFGIISGRESYARTSSGLGGPNNPSLGLPFYNLQIPGDDAYLVAYQDGALERISEGTVSANSDLDMVGADGSLYLLLGRSQGHRVDLLSGYTFNQLNNSIGIRSQATNLDTGDLILNGTVFTTNDLFETENTFHGAHLGVLSSVVSNRVSLSTLAKVSFGNMHQQRSIRGFTRENDGTTTTTTPGGIYAQPSNIGNVSRDNFAFIPELGIKLGVSATENIQLTVGYTFMFWSSVALAGEQVDSTIDENQFIGFPGDRPGAAFRDSTFWMQGIDLGMTFTY